MSTPSSSNHYRPDWIVIFKQETSPTTMANTCRKCADVPVSKSDSAKKGENFEAKAISWKNEAGVVQGIFPLLKVAAMDLEDKARIDLLNSPQVMDIVPNRQRHILGFPHNDAVSSKAVRPLGGSARNKWPFSKASNPVPMGGDGGNTWPFGSNQVNSGNISEEYVRGVRDLADLLLGQLGSAADAAPFAPAASMRDSRMLTWGLQAIGLKGQNGEPTGKGVKVAVLDTGLDLEHPDFVGRVAPANCESFVAGVTSVQDGNGHGTHCCGIVAGPARPVSGPRYAVAPDAELMVGKVMDDTGRGWDSDIFAGIQWAAQKGAQIISLSLGSSREAGERHSMPYENVAAILNQKGINVLLVAAAGNDSKREKGSVAAVSNPAACPSFMAVGAVDSSMQVADFSCAQMDNIGLLDIAAPGVNIHSAAIGGDYVSFDGTSMATPFVAGVAALYLQTHPELSVSDLWARLEINARPRGNHLDYGRGVVQFL
jgi:subtilisin